MIRKFTGLKQTKNHMSFGGKKKKASFAFQKEYKKVNVKVINKYLLRNGIGI